MRSVDVLHMIQYEDHSDFIEPTPLPPNENGRFIHEIENSNTAIPCVLFSPF